MYANLTYTMNYTNQQKPPNVAHLCVPWIAWGMLYHRIQACLQRRNESLLPGGCFTIETYGFTSPGNPRGSCVDSAMQRGQQRCRCVTCAALEREPEAGVQPWRRTKRELSGDSDQRVSVCETPHHRRSSLHSRVVEDRLTL